MRISADDIQNMKTQTRDNDENHHMKSTNLNELT